MNFGLRRQLLVIGLATLALPLASALYIRETEQALRAAQAGFLIDLARGLAPIVSDRLAAAAPDANDESLFAYPLAVTPTLDGFADDWRLDARHRPAVVGGERLRLLAGLDRETLWLHAIVDSTDATQTFELACARSDGSLALARFAPEAPGELPAQSDDPDLQQRLRGNWQPGSREARLELRVPAGLCLRRVGILVNANGRESRSYRGSLPAPLIYQSDALADTLATNRLPGIEAWVVDASGWRVTPVTGERQGARVAQHASGFAARLYRRLLGDDTPQPTLDERAYRFDDGVVADALAGNAGSARFRVAASDAAPTRSVTLAALPLLREGQPVAALVLRQDSAAILTLANPSLTRLTNSIVVITALVVLLLLAYATWLSWRVRRLARAASKALDARGRLRTDLPGRRARDEIGSLTRDVEALLGRVAEHQRYLRTMADTLSHELRTPLAVVQSSLDNLDHSNLDDGQRRLSRRAGDGVQRLRAILNAMSSANRAEQAALDAATTPLDLSSLIRQLGEAYAGTFVLHRFHTDVTDGIRVIGNAELIVQMLDKLVENAIEFAAGGSTIDLCLARDGERVTLSVRNPGPPLPDIDSASLFDTFVSHRGNREPGSHLGFGLYIARLIAEAHNGSIAAANWRDGQRAGVVVTVSLPAGDEQP